MHSRAQTRPHIHTYIQARARMHARTHRIHEGMPSHNDTHTQTRTHTHTHTSAQDGIYAFGKAHIRSTPLSEVSLTLPLKHQLPSNLTFPHLPEAKWSVCGLRSFVSRTGNLMEPASGHLTKVLQRLLLSVWGWKHPKHRLPQ